jgi:cell division protein FtsN
MKETTDMKIEKRAHPPHLKERHESQNPTATSSAIGKSQTEKDTVTSSTPSNSPRTPKAGPSSYITTPTNLGKPPFACASSAMESATCIATSHTWTLTKSPKQLKRR